jgi:F-type H+-transporting ATPase subunit b
MQAPTPASHEGATAPAPEGGAGGLPQFDLAMWPGQMAWLLIYFVIVLVVMSRVIVPRIGGAIDERERKIEGDIAEAWRLKGEAEAQAAQAQAETAQARAQAQRVAGEARARAQGEVAGKLAEEEAKLAAKAAEAEARIAKSRGAAMANVAGIAADTAGAIVGKLTGLAATPAELTAARGS